jgi:hypothetical protein
MVEPVIAESESAGGGYSRPPRRGFAGGLVALAFGLIIAGSALGAEVSIDAVRGRWIATEPSNAAGLEGINTATLKWGIPVSNDAEALLVAMAAALLGQEPPPGATGQSAQKCAFEFEAVPLRSPQQLGSRFLIGRFAHTNVPTDSQSLNKFQAAKLEILVDITLRDRGRALSERLASVFDVELLETENEGPCPGPTDGNGCYDRVTFRLNKARSEALSIDGVEYVFTLTGFLIDGRPAESFWTRELARSEAQLEASLAVAATVGESSEWVRSRPLGGVKQDQRPPPEPSHQTSEAQGARPVNTFGR